MKNCYYPGSGSRYQLGDHPMPETASAATDADGPAAATHLSAEEAEALVTQRCREFIDATDIANGERASLLGQQFDYGLGFVHFPEGHGGLGVSPKLQRVVNEALSAARMPRAAGKTVIGYGMGAPTIVTHGTEEQKHRYLRPLFTGEELWCQLFSEPGAGSDVAALATRAVPDGDAWVVNGQKVWTSFGHLARWGMLLARTDPDVEKHKGLTYFILDMRADGVKTAPLRQATGETEFSEVYFDDVRIPDANRLGEVGDGWRIALTTLMNERVSLGSGKPERSAGPIGEALELWRSSSRRDPAVRLELTRLWIEAEVLRLTNLRAAQARRTGIPGPEGSVGKLAIGELNQRIYELCLEIMGSDGMLYGSYDDQHPRRATDPGFVQREFIRSRANTIEGGTSEVQRNIIGERVLGLPAEPRADKGRPWREVPRS
jgi:alkylation response protein AidB-like acyl-CoA dehydrogenase